LLLDHFNFSSKKINLEVEVPEHYQGYRLDFGLSQLLPDYSRSKLAEWIKSGAVLIDQQPGRGKDKLKGGERIIITAETTVQAPCEPQAIPLDIVYEDEEILVLNKPPGLVVHPAAGHPTGTLVNALLYYCRDLSQLPRAGIVHRLDKNTTGLMVVAKTLVAHTYLVKSLQARAIQRIYQAVAQGRVMGVEKIEAPIGRHPHYRQKMAVVASGRPANSEVEVLQRFKGHTHIRVILGTGRTHQIRVHLSHKGFPLVGDKLYGWHPGAVRYAHSPLQTLLEQFPRQALHAYSLGLPHPRTQQWLSWECPLPLDMRELIEQLEQYKAI
jgi:23S rRNA pseudouridine1911/1915/1917 synthase